MSPRAGLDRGRLADAAVAIADAEGLEAVTIARVAAELGVKGPSLYNHVASREALVREVSIRGATDLVDALALAAAGRSGADALRATGHAYRAFAAASPGRYAAVVRAPSPDDEELAGLARRLLDVLGAVLRGLDLPADEAEQVHVIRGLRATLHGFATLEAGGAFAMDISVDASFEAALDMLLAGIAARVGSAG